MVIKMEKGKYKFILYVISAIIILAGAFLAYKLNFKEEKYSSLININVSELEKKINNKDTFILVLSQTGCSHCEQYLPELNRTLEENDIKAYVLNITDVNEDDSKKLAQHVNFSGTPTTAFFIEGAEKTTLNRFVGYASKTKIVERLKSLGYIK